VRLVDDLLGLVAGCVDDALGFPMGALQFGLAALGGGETFRDFLLSVFDRLGKGRPDELDREPDQDAKTIAWPMIVALMFMATCSRGAR
jgi:hypothetical protein